MDFLKILLLSLLSSILMPISAQNILITAFGKSYELERDRKFAEAISILEVVNVQDSGYEVNLRLGWLNYLGGDLDKSVHYYRKALSIRPYCIEARLGLVLPLSGKDEWGNVVTVYNEILGIDPQNTLVNYRMGLIHYEWGQFEKADGYLKKVVNLFPFDYDSLLLLAWTKLKMGQMREAQMLFNKVLLHNPEDESALEGLGLMKTSG